MNQAGNATPDVNDDPLPTLRQSPVVRWLIGLNIIIFALDQVLRLSVKGDLELQGGLLTRYGNFNVMEGINGHEYWRLITYQFLHGGFVHLGMNMMALYVFGPMVEKWWGSRRFIAFYLLCGACGAWLMAVFSYVQSLVDANQAWLVGASGSIFGVLVAVAMIYPKVEVKLILPPIWITVRKLAIIFLLLSFGSMFVGENVGGNAAHIGGAFFGFLLVRRPWSLDFADPRAPRLDPPGGVPPEK